MQGTIDSILQCLREHTDHDFAGLRKAMAERRIGGRMRARGCATPESYLRLLCESSEERDLLLHALTIKISSFYRYPIAWEMLRMKVLPRLLDEAGDRPLRVWSAGCSTGEEVYTFMMIYHELARIRKRTFDVQCFATDIDRAAIEFAEEGVYPAGQRVHNLPARLLESGFDRCDTGYRVKPHIREHVHFSLHDQLSQRSFAPADSLFGEFDLIMCRNVLIFYQEPQFSLILDHLLDSLRIEGWLMLGEAGRMPMNYYVRFQESDGYSHIYQRLE